MSFSLLPGRRVPLMVGERIERFVSGLCLSSLMLLAQPGVAAGQANETTQSVVAEPPWEARHFILEATAVGISPQVYGNLGSRLRLGAVAGVGYTLAVALNERDYTKREVLNAGAVVACRVGREVGLELSPLRVSYVSGSNFSVAYPSAHVRVFFAQSRVRFSTQFTVVRVVGPNGTGIYPVWWTPILVAFSF